MTGTEIVREYDNVRAAMRDIYRIMDEAEIAKRSADLHAFMQDPHNPGEQRFQAGLQWLGITSLIVQEIEEFNDHENDEGGAG